MEMTKDMEKAYNELALARVCREALKKRKEQLEEELRLANSEIYGELERETDRVATLEEILRSLALDQFKATGTKAWQGGVEVKEFVVLDYQEPDALAWAKEHRVALKLDRPAFDRIAKASPEEFPFVKISKEPRAQIPQKMVVKEGEAEASPTP